MVQSTNDTKTRRDFQEERHREMYQRSLADTMSADELDELAAATADTEVREENERIWAHYRDPRSDVTQLEARDRAQHVDYPKRYQVSQSTVSRRLSALDYDMLTEPIDVLGFGEAIMVSDEAEALDHYDTDHVLKTYRSALARFIVDMLALKKCTSFSESAPKWAANRFEEVNPAVGIRVKERFEEGHSRVPAADDD